MSASEFQAQVLIVGAGGIGSPAALSLVLSGIERLALADGDKVELSNLHRQILFNNDDIGRPKLEAFCDALKRRSPSIQLYCHPGRLLPNSIADAVARADVILDATDNFASRFLIADAAYLGSKPVIHAAGVRWQATVMTVSAQGRPCYRCLFEDLPRENAPDCASAGVAGPVCGVAGSIAADRVLSVLAGQSQRFGSIVTFDGLRDRLREVRVKARLDCALCGSKSTIRGLDARRYSARACEI